ncbi:Uncharacterised protein [Vibrio cholerae]|nr:Uncharacterised protein [Vibrio cholerae]CSI37168.1 Uncharacterised protein [Vibrio cholerae]CSI72918.1 Uncharacterised protein [Vibrio cholerae]
MIGQEVGVLTNHKIQHIVNQVFTSWEVVEHCCNGDLRNLGNICVTTTTNAAFSKHFQRDFHQL